MANSAVTVADLEIVISYRNQGSPEKQINKITNALSNVNSSSGKATKQTGKFFSSIKRIAGYRILRTILKEITQGLGEGIKNFYQFDKAMGGTFSKAMDRLTTNLSALKNSFGALIGSVIVALEPILEKIIDAIIVGTEKMSHFLAVLMNKDYYYKATKSAKEFAAAQRKILGFDELNTLSNSQTDTASLFEKVYIGATDGLTFMQRLKIAFTDVVFEDMMKDDTTAIASLGGALMGIAAGIMAFSITGDLVTATIATVLTFAITKSAFQNVANQSGNTVAGLIVAAFGGLLAGSIAMKLLTAASVASAGTVAAVIGLTVGAVIIFKILKAEFDKSKIKQTMDAEGFGTGLAYGYMYGGNGFADGGYPAQGSMFIAGEAGPEFVGNVGGRTAVYNRDQLSSSLASANENVVSAINTLINVVNSKDFNMYLNQQKVGSNVAGWFGSNSKALGV